jgi:hypothetical protein
MGKESLVVPELSCAMRVRVRGVEHGHTRVNSGRDRLESEPLVAAVVCRQAHAPETDAELRGVQPTRAIQETKGTPKSKSRLHARRSAVRRLSASPLARMRPGTDQFSWFAVSQHKGTE